MRQLESEFRTSAETCVPGLGVGSTELTGLLPLVKFICFMCMTVEKEMVTHSIILAWKISWTEKPGRLPSRGSPRVRLD